MTEEKETNEPEEILYEDADTRADVIAEIHNALNCLEMFDAAMIGKKAERQIRNIRRRSLDILDYYVKEIHDEIFEEDEGED